MELAVAEEDQERTNPSRARVCPGRTRLRVQRRQLRARVRRPFEASSSIHASNKIDVDLDSLPASDNLDAALYLYYVIDWCRRAIEHGHDPLDPYRWTKEGTDPPVTDRSRALFAGVIDLHRSGVPDKLVFSICLNPRHHISVHSLEKGGSRSIERALQVAYGSALSARDSQSRAGSAPVENLWIEWSLHRSKRC